MTTLSWQETRGILLELESLYRDGSDAGSVIRGETAVKAFLTGSKQRCSDAKRSICQLANEAENKENLAKEIDVEDEASRQFEEQKVRIWDSFILKHSTTTTPLLDFTTLLLHHNLGKK
eukprot:322179_1